MNKLNGKQVVLVIGEDPKAMRLSGFQYVRTEWDISEVLDHVYNSMCNQDKITFFNTPFEDLILYHHGLGTWIRNTFGLWGSNPFIKASMCMPLDTHPDEVSFEIIKALWRTVRGR